MSKTDIRVLKRGLKRLAFSVLTVITFALALGGLIATAFVPGYWAVLLFLASAALGVFALGLLYANGLTNSHREERPGEDK